MSYAIRSVGGTHDYWFCRPSAQNRRWERGRPAEAKAIRYATFSEAQQVIDSGETGTAVGGGSPIVVEVDDE